ncbi:hypothetical protein LTS10_004334 [Elasticomyces elasticus]|nr:hypothetical protein LTS10_004334 [Elasticomyces elasticus]
MAPVPASGLAPAALPLNPPGSTMVFAPSFPTKFYDDKQWLRTAPDYEIAALLQPHLFSQEDIRKLQKHNGISVGIIKASSDEKTDRARGRVAKVRAMHDHLEKRAGANITIPLVWWKPKLARPGSAPNLACLTAKLAAYYDVAFRSHHARTAWQVMRSVEPKLLPWGPDEKMEDVNSTLLAGSFLRGCLPDFVWKHFETVTEPLPSTLETKSWILWCPDHQVWENYTPVQYLHYQLSCGMLSFEEWCMIMTRIPQRDACAGQLQGSHSCGNSWCIGLFCVKWESVVNNQNRKACHDAVVGRDPLDPSPVPLCACTSFQLTGVECNTDARMIDRELKRQELIALRRNNRESHGRCPMPGCSKLQISKSLLRSGTGKAVRQTKESQKDNGPKLYYSKTNRAICKHLVSEHGYKMEGMFVLK